MNWPDDVVDKVAYYFIISRAEMREALSAITLADIAKLPEVKALKPYIRCHDTCDYRDKNCECGCQQALTPFTEASK